MCGISLCMRRLVQEIESKKQFGRNEYIQLIPGVVEVVSRRLMAKSLYRCWIHEQSRVLWVSLSCRIAKLFMVFFRFLKTCSGSYPEMKQDRLVSYWKQHEFIYFGFPLSVSVTHRVLIKSLTQIRQSQRDAQDHCILRNLLHVPSTRRDGSIFG